MHWELIEQEAIGVEIDQIVNNRTRIILGVN